MQVIGLGHKELAELGLSFISIKVPVFPVLTRTYSMKMQFFVSTDLLVKTLKEVDPLIIFDTTGAYQNQPRINSELLPDFIKMNGGGVYVRAVTDIPRADWKLLKDNIIDTGDHNFTFEWNTSCYNDKDFLKAEEKSKRDEERRKQFDKEEIEIYTKEPTKSGKVYIKKW